MNEIEAELRKEGKLRHELKKLGYSLKKSRSNQITVDNLGGYMITDTGLNTVVAGSRFDLTIEEVENFVKE